MIIAGGVETFSDVPIRLNRKWRQKLIGFPKAMKKGNIAAVQYLFKGPGLMDFFKLETPAIANYTTGSFTLSRSYHLHSLLLLLRLTS